MLLRSNSGNFSFVEGEIQRIAVGSLELAYDRAIKKQPLCNGCFILIDIIFNYVASYRSSSNLLKQASPLLACISDGKERKVSLKLLNRAQSDSPSFASCRYNAKQSL